MGNALLFCYLVLKVGGASSCFFSYLCLSDRKSILYVLEDSVNDWRTGMFLSPKN